MNKQRIWGIFLWGMMFIGAVYAEIQEKNSHNYCVILAGGSGERLWPLSRTDLPKQFLSVAFGKTLLEQAVERARMLVPKEHILVSTTQQQLVTMKKHIGVSVGDIIPEPASRNTGPAILLCCFTIFQRDPDAVIAFLPADPFIPDQDIFADYLRKAVMFAQEQNAIILLGLKPRYAATGYGYIEANLGENKEQKIAYQVNKFHEKPCLSIAQDYIKRPEMFWNIGIFCAKASVFLHEFATHAPIIFEGVRSYVQGTGLYEQVFSDSIDYAVMEKSKNVYVLPVDFSWCDVGNIDVFLSIKKEYNDLPNNVLSVESKNNLVDVKGKLVALVGVEDLCIVDTGDVLLVTKRNDAEKVKAIVKKLKETDRKTYL